MSIDNEQTQKSSKPNAQANHFEKQKDDTPGRVPVVRPAPVQQTQPPAWTPPVRPVQRQQQTPVPPLPQEPARAIPSRPMPAKEYSRYAMALSQQGTIPLPPSIQQRERASVPAPPPLIAEAHARRPRKRGRLAIPVLGALVLLAILIALGSFFAGNASSIPGKSSSIQTAHVGAFVHPPLNAAQLSSLQHLVKYMKYKQLASMYVARMPLDVELGQLIMVEYADTYYSPDLDTMVNKLHAGGVIMYEFQMQTLSQTKHDIAEMQAHATLPLIVSTDEEGGPYVHRLKNIYGLRMSATDIYNTGNPNVATQQGHQVAHDLLSLGINENLAPDVDVNLVNGYDMVTRTFGNDPASVIKFAGPYMQAMQSDGVIACIKHYPGLGDAVTDAHTSLPVVNRTRQQLYDVELNPFKTFIQSQNALDNPGMIMPTDVLMPAIDPVYPAELSHIFMTDILRNQFGYDGVVLTDALYMQGISAKWSQPEAAVMALNAGNDMLLGPTGAGQMIEVLNAIKQALQDGTLSKARVDQAVTRIIALKMEYHLMPAVPPQS